jgi:formylglycine-generating enzyme required for sulfatase activity
MPGKIFVNYRRDDERAMAARIRDRLAGTFGDRNVFMDVDHLVAGQVFEAELEKALAETDVFIAVLGPRWLELLAERQGSGERDYVREEIAGALRRGIVVVPVLIERAPLPRADALPDDIRALVSHQKHAVTHEQFGRDIAGLIEAIRFARKAARAGAGGGGVSVRWAGAVALTALALGGGVLAYQMGVFNLGQGEKRQVDHAGEINAAKTLPVASEPAEIKPVEEKKRESEVADAKSIAVEGVQARRAAEEAERQRLAMLKAEQDRKLAETEANSIAKEAAARHDPALSVTPGSGRSFRDCRDCPEMVVVPAGEFMMGSPPSEAGGVFESPQHKVTITRPFAVGKYEATFAEWDACVADRGCKHRPYDQWGRGRRPVINVSWNDAKEYVAWLSSKTGKPYRLLSEAEWEHAARAGTTSRYAFGDTITASQAQFDAQETVEVGSFPANGFGLHDLHGNVMEWVEDTWHEGYQGAPADGSVWQGGDMFKRVLRGGSWYDTDFLRSASRYYDRAGLRGGNVGFRVARTL